MEHQKWLKIEAVFAAAIHLPEAEQLKYVGQQVENNPGLVQEIMTLLEKDNSADGFLSQSMLTLGTKIIGSNPQHLIERESFGFYKIKELVGRGGMGEVFLAEDTRLDRPVALKILPVELTENSVLWHRFQQEARAASRVTHPNVAHIYEFGKHYGLYYLAMEFVPGLTLRELIRSNTIDLPEALKIIKQIVSALQQAHFNQIVHCDIKPENIIVGPSGALKVLDFGVAKYRNSRIGAESINRDDLFSDDSPVAMGTVPYMSPEQINRETLDPQTDLWSVGVIFYELLAGKRPFGGSNDQEIISAICRLPPNLLPAGDYPRAAGEIISRCLEKNKHDRYQNAAQLHEDLDQLESLLTERKSAERHIKNQKAERFLSGLSAIRPGYLLAAICFLIIFAGSMSYFFYSSSAKTVQKQLAATGSVKKISDLAVLKLRVRSADGDSVNLDNFSTEFGHELIEVLGKSSVCTIKSESDTLRYENTKDASFVGRKLGADSVLRGEITRSGNQYQVNLELVETNQNAILWQDEFHFDNLNFLDWRYTLLNAISRNLMPHLDREKLPAAAGDRLSSLYFNRQNKDLNKAYQLYLEGKYSKGTAAQSINKLNESVEINPNFGLVYLALATKYWTIYEYSPEQIERYPEANIDNIKSQLQLAVFLDKNNSEAHRFISQIYWSNDRNWAAAERELKTAIESNPNDEWALFDYGSIVLPAKGEFTESLNVLEKTRKIMPLVSEVPAAIARTKFLLRDYEGAIYSSDQALSLNRNDAKARAIKAISLSKLQRNVEALKTANEFDENSELVGLEGRISRALVYGASGDAERVRQIIREIEQVQKLGNKNVTPYRLALVYAALPDPTRDEKNKIYVLLQEEDKLKSTDSLMIKYNPLLDSAASDPRFAKFKSYSEFEKS